MTTTTEERTEKAHVRTTGEAARSRGRVVIGITLVIALIVSAVLQQVAFSYRTSAVNRNREGLAAPSRMANLDSFSLALLLGGLRGPLVMFLWTNSESQKSDKDLESFDTQVELIRLLQPEFDTVHLFQIWNKAYNVSVQLASLSNKYATILDAVNANPNDINILAAMGGLFTDKLGNSSEKEYYRRRVRTETLPLYRVSFAASREGEFKKAVGDAGLDQAKVRVTTSGDKATAIMEKLGGDRVLALFRGNDVKVEAVPRQQLRPESRSGRRTQMDTMLDAKGYILPQYLKATHGVPSDRPANNGAELQYLEPFQPFPYGLSPLAIGYNYHKQAQILQRYGNQKHVQLSEQVIDNQPALALRMWAEEEWDRGRRLEQRGLAAMPGEDQATREIRTAAAAPDAKIVDRASVDEAIFSYFRAADAAKAGQPEITQHIDRYPGGVQNYRMQRDTLVATEHLMRADGLYLQAVEAEDGAGRKKLLEQAKAEYLEAWRAYGLMMLKYYVDEPEAAALKYSPATVQDKSLAELKALREGLLQQLVKTYKSVANSPHASDVQEYDEDLRRIDKRLELIK
jgi:hypothetical protein